MNLKEIVELAGIAAGGGVLVWGLNEFRKKYVGWAEKNNFYDEDVKFDDLDGVENNYFSNEKKRATNNNLERYKSGEEK